MKSKKSKIIFFCNRCPKCGAREQDIEWGVFTADEFPTQSATCIKCGCEFTEVYKYDHTTVEE